MDKSVKFRIELDTNGAKVFETLSVNAEDFRSAIEETVGNVRNLTDEIGKMTQQAVLLDSMTSIIDNLNKSVGALADSYNRFDVGMRAVNTMAGLNKDGLEELTAQVEELSAKVPVAKEALANGLYQVISNGVPEDNWIGFLEQSARASVGGIADLGQTVTVTSTIIKNYGLAWSSAGEIQDKIQTTAKNGVTSFEQLAQALPRVTGSASALGVKVDELFAAFATLTGVTGNTAEVSTQLAAVFTALTKPSSEATEMARQMGIQFDAAAIKAAGGMRNFLTQLDSDIKSYASAHGMLDQEIYGKLFGSAESLRALIALNGELSDKFGENIDAMAESAGTIDTCFEDMAGSGEAVTQMLENQLTSMLSWAGGIASAIQPYLTFVAVGGQAIIGFQMLYKSIIAGIAAVKAFTIAQKGSATATALATINEKVQTMARNMLTMATGSATVGTTALTVATLALYAALTMGISVVITGLVSLFSSLGDEAEDAAEDVDLLKDATDAFNNTTANTQAELELEKVKLQELIKTNGDATSMVQKLNQKYGEALGYHEDAAEWYDVLINKSEAYCRQLAYEAEAKVLSSQLGAKKAEYETKMSEYMWLQQTFLDSNGKSHYNWEQVGYGQKYFEQLGSEVGKLQSEISTLQGSFENCTQKMLSAQKEVQEAFKETKKEIDWQTASYTDLGKAIEAQKTKVSGLAGVSGKESEAKEEAATLKKMEERYKQLGKKYNLSTQTKSANKDPYDGKKLIANAETYKELGNNIKYYQTQLEQAKPSEEDKIRTLTATITQLQEQQDAISRLYAEMGRPAELKTLKDFDTEIAYQRSLRATASKEELGDIDAEIRSLNNLRDAFEQSSHVPVMIEEIETLGEIESEISYNEKLMKSAGTSERAEISKTIGALKRKRAEMENMAHEDVLTGEITTYERLDGEISYYEGRLKRCTETERGEIQKRINELKKLREAWDWTLEEASRPAEIGSLKNVGELEEAISWYSNQMQRQSAEEIEATQRTITALERKREVLQRLASIPKIEREVEDLSGLKGKKLKIELEAIGIEGIKEKIRSLQKLLDDTKNPLGDVQRKEVEGLILTYKRYEKQLKRSQLKVEDAWGSVKGIGNAVESMTDALKGNGNAWEKITAVVDGVLELYSGFGQITSMIGLLTGVSEAHAASKVVEAGAETTETAATEAGAVAAVAASAATTAALGVETGAWSALAAAKTIAAHAEIPFVGTGIAAAFIAQQQMLIAMASIPKFANGGIAYGPTLGIFGEYAGAANNPEVVAPLNKLKQLIEPQGGGTSGEVRFRIEGRTLVGLLAKEERIRERTK